MVGDSQKADKLPSERRLFAEREDEWCEARISLTGSPGAERLSITGTAGTIQDRDDAESHNLDFWRSFFEEDDERLADMVRRFGVSSVEEATQRVVDVDGPLHGQDVFKEDSDRVYLVDSCGCIHDTLAEWFPEIAQYIKWHLNDMKSTCEHQEALGWTYDTHGGQSCPECGYQIGTSWLRRDLPTEVLKWARTAGEEVA